MFDSYKEVSAAARNSMAVAFPGPKMREALLFCRSEVGLLCLWKMHCIVLGSCDELLNLRKGSDAGWPCASRMLRAFSHIFSTSELLYVAILILISASCLH